MSPCNRLAIWKKSEMAPRLICFFPLLRWKIRDSRAIDRLSRTAPVQSKGHLRFLPDGQPTARVPFGWLINCAGSFQMTDQLRGSPPRWPIGYADFLQMKSRLHKRTSHPRHNAKNEMLLLDSATEKARKGNARCRPPHPVQRKTLYLPRIAKQPHRRTAKINTKPCCNRTTFICEPSPIRVFVSYSNFLHELVFRKKFFFQFPIDL